MKMTLSTICGDSSWREMRGRSWITSEGYVIRFSGVAFSILTSSTRCFQDFGVEIVTNDFSEDMPEMEGQEEVRRESSLRSTHSLALCRLWETLETSS